VLEAEPLTRLGSINWKEEGCDPVLPNDHAGVEGLSVVAAVVAADVGGAEFSAG
jgi:hypothetical protein